MTIVRSKKIFDWCAACVCLTFGTIFLVIASFMALGIVIGVMTISFALPIDLYNFSLDLRNWLVYKDFILKDTNLLVHLP